MFLLFNIIAARSMGRSEEVKSSPTTSAKNWSSGWISVVVVMFSNALQYANYRITGRRLGENNNLNKIQNHTKASKEKALNYIWYECPSLCSCIAILSSNNTYYEYSRLQTELLRRKANGGGGGGWSNQKSRYTRIHDAMVEKSRNRTGLEPSGLAGSWFLILMHNKC